jgi:PAT family beta-lactamase induction signal transducer AmpG
MLDPKLELSLIAAVFLIAFLSASQDVVIDAYRREILAEEEQGLGAPLSSTPTRPPA